MPATGTFKRVTAKMVRCVPGVRTTWEIQFWKRNRLTGIGPAYFAHTYPDSDLLTIETAAKRRPVSKLVGARIHEAVKLAIEYEKAHRATASAP